VEVGQDRRRLVDVVVERIEPVVGRPRRERLGRLDIGRGRLPHRVGLRGELTLLLCGQGLEIVGAPVDQRAVGDEPLARGGVTLLDGGFAQVVSLHEQVPDLLDELGLLDGLLAELLERRDREAERDQSCPATAATGNSMVTSANLKRPASDDRGAGIWPMEFFSAGRKASLRRFMTVEGQAS
jgi:hypothetical protein